MVEHRLLRPLVSNLYGLGALESTLAKLSALNPIMVNTPPVNLDDAEGTEALILALRRRRTE